MEIKGGGDKTVDRVLIGYWDADGKFMPLSVVHHLPADTNFSNILSLGLIRIYPTGDYELPYPSASQTMIENYTYMFDGRLDTYSVWHFHNGSAGITDPAYIWFGGEGYKLNKLLLYYDIGTGDITNLSWTVLDTDGNEYSLTATTTSLTVLGNTRNLLQLTGFPDKPVVQVKISHNTGIALYTEVLVREMRIYLVNAIQGEFDVKVSELKDVITLDSIQDMSVTYGTATDMTKMFDMNPDTFCEFNPTGSSESYYFTISFKEPKQIDRIIIKADDSSGTILPKFGYVDGYTTDDIFPAIQTNPSGVSYDVYLNPYPSRKVNSIEFDLSVATWDVYELYVFKHKDLPDSKVYSNLVIRPEAVASGEEYFYYEYDLRSELLVRGSLYVDRIVLHKRTFLKLSEGSKLELGGV